MKVVTYTSTDAPEAHRGLAMFLSQDPSPVFTTASTAEEACRKLLRFWDAQVEHERQKTAMNDARSEKLKKPKLKKAA